MKILYLHQYFVTPEESGATRSYEIARRLVERGHEVDLLTTDQHPESQSTWQTKEVDGIRVHAIGVPYNNAMSFGERMRAFTSFATSAREYGSTLDADLIYATSTPLTIAWPAVKLSRARQVPMVFEVRDLWPEVPIAIGALQNPIARTLAYRLERYAYENAHAIVGLSPGISNSIAARYPNKRIETIPNACDLDLFKRTANAGHAFRQSNPWLGTRPLITYMGTFGEANGVDYAVRLANELSTIAPEIRTLLIGSGKYFDSVKASANQLGLLDKSVFVRASVPKKEAPTVLHATDLALSLFIDLPILATNSANKFFDAIAAGTPIAINYDGWQAHVIRSYQCGLVLPPDDVSRGARQLAEFVQDRKIVATTGIRARHLAETLFSRDALVDKLAVLLEELNANSRYQPKG